MDSWRQDVRRTGGKEISITAVDATPGPTSLSRQIYEAMREGIIRGRYAQGSRLAEQRLAEELEVSRVPLREAVPLLAVDGFVRTLPRRSAVVSTWSTDSANDLFDLRLCLEVGAARYAARQVAGGTSIAPLEAALDQSRQGLRTRDSYRIAGDSTQFHEAVVELTSNALMRSIMRSVSGRMMWMFYMTSDLDPVDALDDHEELLDVVASGNERLAESVSYTHIERDRTASLDILHSRYRIPERDVL